MVRHIKVYYQNHNNVLCYHNAKFLDDTAVGVQPTVSTRL